MGVGGMEVLTTVEGTKALLKVVGKVTVQTATQLKATVMQLPSEVKDIDVDVAEVKYLSSAGLRVLVLAAKLCRSRGGVMRTLHPTEEVLDVLTMTGLEGLLMPQT